MKKPTHYIAVLPFILILIFFAVQSSAQSYFFRHYQVENGLSNNTVYCSAQDKSGFMWFGTKDGLNRFDGYQFKVFNMDADGHTMVPNLIGCLLVDKKNELYVGSQKGLYTFNRQNEQLVRLIDSFPDINSIQTDKYEQLWFISKVTVCRYDPVSKKVQVFPPAKYFEATSLCLSDEGEIWAATPGGFIHRFNEATKSFQAFNMFSHSPPATSYRIQKIYPAGNGAIYIGTTNQGLKRFDVAAATYTDLLTLNPDKTTVYVRDIKKYTDDECWIATESGIFIYNPIAQKFTNLKKKLADPYSLSDNAVYNLCIDREGGIWAGTYFGGINYYSKQYAVFEKYFPDNSTNSISGSVVREICEDQWKNLWVGTEDAGLNKINPKTGAITQFKPTGESNSIAYTNIHGLLAAGTDLWIGTFEHGLDVMDIKTGKVRMHFSAGPGKKDLKSNFIVSLLKTKAGEIYIGSGNSLFKYDKQSNGFDPVAETPPNIFVSSLLEDHNKTIWIGTHDSGLHYFNPTTKQKGKFTNEPGNSNSLTGNTINAIYEDSEQNLWLSTEGGGLCRLNKDRKTFIAITTQNGLPSNFVFKVLEGDKNNFWVTTSRGIVNLQTNNNLLTVYTKDNGLLNDQFNYNSGFKNATGSMFFGSVKGMISFKPIDFLKTTIEAPVYITGFQVQNRELQISNDSTDLKKSILYTDEITLPYNRSSFSIDFAALSYISPAMTSFRYIMEGLDKEWTVVKPNRKIYFTNLSPGTYTFKLKAAVNGQWSQKEKQLIINILAPFWATTWAYLLYLLIAVGIGYYLLRSYHTIVEDKKEKEIYEAKIDFFTNIAHEIRTPLTLIKGPVENLLELVEEVPEIKEDVITMERNTNRLIALITQILDFRQTETKGFSVDFLKVNITALLKDSFITFSALAKKKNLHYNIELPVSDVFAFADEEALTKIFSNLINNCIKYAGKKVVIRLLKEDNEESNFSVEFENDGTAIPQEMKEKIFEPFYRLKQSIKQQGTGLGLALARSLTELHKGKLYLKDSKEGLNIFILCLPLKPEQQKIKIKN